MQVSNDSTDTRPSAPESVDRVKAPTRLSDIEAAADFERWLDRAQAAAEIELPAVDDTGRSSTSADDASAAKGSPADGDDGSCSDSDSDSEPDIDPRFAQPAWAAQSFGAAMPALDAAALAQAHAPAPQAWAEIAAQIERLLMTNPVGRPDGAAALFRLAPEVLRDTTVALSRTPQGWLLRIDSQDARLRVDSTRHEAALRERFAKGGLGDLVIEEGDLPDLAF
jgi:Type III secretion protein (HpaP)